MMENKKNFVMKKSLYLFSIIFIFIFSFVSSSPVPQDSFNSPDINFVNDPNSAMIDGACGYYRGYYDMSSDMGSLILKLGILFGILEIIHGFIKFLFEKFFSSRVSEKQKSKKSDVIENPMEDEYEEF